MRVPTARLGFASAGRKGRPMQLHGCGYSRPIPARCACGPPAGVAAMSVLECVVYIGLSALVALVAGAGIAWVLIRRADRQNLASADARSKELLTQAERTAENVL